MTTEAVYDRIGKTYDQTRKADPAISKKIINHLSPTKAGQYLDVGCGSGNYTQMIAENGYRICGVDISEEMLAKARNKSHHIEWIFGLREVYLFKAINLMEQHVFWQHTTLKI